MPWRGPEYPGEFPTLGYLVAEWIEAFAVVPDGDDKGEPFRLSDPQLEWVLHFYRLQADDERVEFRFRRGQLVAPQKWGKGPLSAAIICAELLGPVRPAGFNAAGEPVGRPWSTPWVQVTATTEDQTQNVWRALQPMIELGPLADLIPDTGLTRINVPGGGLAEPVTSAAGSRLGQRITFANQDETHSWITPQMHKLAVTQRRNLAGTNGRSMETTNGWDPAELSVAQRTAEAKATDILRVHRVPKGNPADPAQLDGMIRDVYRGCHWVRPSRIAAEYAEIAETDRPQADRFFLNLCGDGASALVDSEAWNGLARETGLADGELVSIAVHGSPDTSVVVVGCSIETGTQSVLASWEPETSDWEIPTGEIQDVLDEIFGRFGVDRCYINPTGLADVLSALIAKHGKTKVFEWWTGRPRPMCFAVDRWLQAIRQKSIGHDGGLLLAQHVRQAQRRQTQIQLDDGRRGAVIRRESPTSQRWTNGAEASVMAWEARADAIQTGALDRARRRRNRGNAPARGAGFT